MVVSGPSLPLRIYLGGSGKYPFLNLSAFNTWGIFVRFGVNLQEVDFPFGLDAGKINIAIILICALITAILIAYIKRTVGCLDVRILTLLVCLFYNTVFIISTQPDVYLEVQHPCWSCNSNSSSANASAGVR